MLESGTGATVRVYSSPGERREEKREGGNSMLAIGRSESERSGMVIFPVALRLSGMKVYVKGRG